VILRAARSEHATGWLFVAPAVILIGIFGVIPIGWSLILSFQHNDLISPPTWVGLDNYKALKDDPVFTESVKRTIVYTLLFVPLSVGGALLIALALNAPLRLGTLYRTAVFVRTSPPLSVIDRRSASDSIPMPPFTRRMSPPPSFWANV